MRPIIFALVLAASSCGVFADSISQTKLEGLTAGMSVQRIAHCDGKDTFVAEQRSRAGDVAYEVITKSQHFIVVEKPSDSNPLRFYFGHITMSAHSDKLVWDATLQTQEEWKTEMKKESPDFFAFYFSPKEKNGCTFRVDTSHAK